MTAETGPKEASSAAPAAAFRLAYVIIFALPALLWCVNSNWLFQNIGHMDPWYYFGSFHHFPRMQNLQPNYAGERMVWIFPGFVFVHLFGQVTGVILLHCSVFLISLLAFHSCLLRIADRRTALLATVLLGCHPFFVGANGWDHIDSICICCLTVSAACAMRASRGSRFWIPLVVSGWAWFTVLYTYPGFAVLTPAWLFLAYCCVRQGRRGRLAAQWTAASALAGALLATASIWAIYRVLGGQGFFFAKSFSTALEFYKLKTNPGLDPLWYRSASWLVFPSLAFAFGVGAAAATAAGKTRLSDMQKSALVFYLFSFAAMALLSLRPIRILAADCYAGILMPGAFFTLAMTMLRVPETVSPRLFYGVMVVGSGIAVLPLARPGLFLLALRWGLAIPIVLVLLAAACSLWNHAHPLYWMASVLLICGAGFGLAPRNAGAASGFRYHGRDIAIRVARSIEITESHLPPGRYPVFWIDNFEDPLSPEYRAIMCSFLTHSISMWHFPRLDPGSHYPAGTRLVVIAPGPEIFPAASAQLAAAGMPVTMVAQDSVVFGGVSYWITQMEVLPPSMAQGEADLSPTKGRQLLPCSSRGCPDDR